MKTFDNILRDIDILNPSESIVSSLGSFVSPMHRQMADDKCIELQKIVDHNSLAYKILTSTEHFSHKQLCVITYELLKHEDYCKKVNEFYDKIDREELQKQEDSAMRLANNKKNSQPVLDYVKQNGKLLKDYYQFLKSTRKFAKEFYSKRFSMESAQEFINL